MLIRCACVLHACVPSLQVSKCAQAVGWFAQADVLVAGILPPIAGTEDFHLAVLRG